MRILFTFIGGQGHFWPLVPVARAAAAAGHEVAVSGPGKVVHVARTAGFTAFETSEPHPGGVDPNIGVRDSEPLKPVDREGDELEYAENFARKGTARHATAVLKILADWKPDVVVRDETDLGAGIAAERSGVPCAVLIVLGAGTLVRKDLVGPPLAELRAEHGLPADPDLTMLDGHLVLAPFPPSFRDPDSPLPDSSLWFRSAEPAPARPRSEPPQVYFTLGTVFNGDSGDLFERVLAGLAAVDANVVVTIGPKLDPESFGPQPDHVRLERFIDQHELLPTCDLVISHGGSGSMTGALAHGLPSILLPMGADQSHNTERAVALGVARELDAATVTPAEITAAVTAALADDALRARAAEVQAELNALPGPEAAIPLIEALAR